MDKQRFSLKIINLEDIIKCELCDQVSRAVYIQQVISNSGKNAESSVDVVSNFILIGERLQYFHI